MFTSNTIHLDEKTVIEDNGMHNGIRFRGESASHETVVFLGAGPEEILQNVGNIQRILDDLVRAQARVLVLSLPFDFNNGKSAAGFYEVVLGAAIERNVGRGDIVNVVDDADGNVSPVRGRVRCLVAVVEPITEAASDD